MAELFTFFLISLPINVYMYTYVYVYAYLHIDGPVLSDGEEWLSDGEVEGIVIQLHVKGNIV